jgi:hypothetical protein
MKKIQEEIYKKLILFKNKGDTINRIRKEKTIPKRGITSVLENQREEQLKKPKSIEKKKQIDRYPIKIEKNYIENIENKYINPFVNNDNIIYTELIENKRSKIPLNFF